MHATRPEHDELPVLSDGVVTLRAPAPADIDAITDACQDPSVTRYTSIPAPYERAHAESFVRDSAQHWADRLSANFVITDADSGELLGSSGIIRLDDPHRVVEVGYWLKFDARGHGYVTRAVRLLTDWVFDELGADRLELQADVRNIASQRVAERSGFVREGEVPAPERMRDRSTTMVMFARVPSSRVRT